MPAETRHVRVRDGDQGTTADGLLVAWQPNAKGDAWAWVVTVVNASDGAPAVRQQWYEQDAVTLIKTRPLSPDPHRWHRGLYSDEQRTAASRRDGASRRWYPVRQNDRAWVTPRVRHVWVQTSRSHEPPAAGLLITWQHAAGAWWGWVVSVIAEPGTSPTMVQHWYHQKDLRPISPQPISTRTTGSADSAAARQTS
jgi:hypothetical protein